MLVQAAFLIWQKKVLLIISIIVRAFTLVYILVVYSFFMNYLATWVRYPGDDTGLGDAFNLFGKIAISIAFIVTTICEGLFFRMLAKNLN